MTVKPAASAIDVHSAHTPNGSASAASKMATTASQAVKSDQADVKSLAECHRSPFTTD